MMEIVPYSREHVLPLVKQAINADVRAAYEGGMAEQLEKSACAVTVMVDGEPMCCGGTMEIWHGRALIWTIFNEKSRHCFVQTIRGIREFLASQLKVFNRLEISVPVGFETGHRRAKLLGFQVECPLARKFLPGGEDCVLYSMVRD